jgi:thimet oligopeptidase
MMTPAPELEPLGLPSSEGYLAWLDGRCDADLAHAKELVARLKEAPAAAPATLRTWNDVNVAIANVLGLATLMANVHPDEPVRERAERAQQDAQLLVTELGLDRELYDVLAAVDPDGLDDDARRLLRLSLRDFGRAGVDRDDETRARIRSLSERTIEVGQQFDRNIRDGALSIRVAPEQLDGLPEDYREAHQPEADGLVTIRTDYPDYLPLMTFATDRAVRSSMVEAYLNRAWPENDEVLAELLRLRREHAQALSYPDWPSYDAEVKMIGTGPAIIDFVDRITEIAAESGRRDYGTLLERLQADHPHVTTVDSTDKAFYLEVVRKERFDVDAQEVRQYFAFARVRAGLLEVTGRLFGLEYHDVPDAPRWHEDVTVYDVHADGQHLGRIYLDLHPRPSKYSHAAQFDLVPGVDSRQLAEGVLVCNLPRGLMDHDDVVTLFHEFGHLLHHVLAGRHDWVRFSGVATEWDFVEAPSQMLEEWAWDATVLQTFGINASGEPIPAALVSRMREANEFGKGFDARTQMFYAATSYTLHQDVPDDVTATTAALQGSYDLFGYVPGTHFCAAFGHLNGYSSGYYTYMWSLVIAKDLFSAFNRDDLFAPDLARRYRDAVLVPGGSKDAADLVEDFLGRPYSFDAFREWLLA